MNWKSGEMCNTPSKVRARPRQINEIVDKTMSERSLDELSHSLGELQQLYIDRGYYKMELEYIEKKIERLEKLDIALKKEYGI